MTLPDFFGLMSVFFLLGDLGLWMHWLRALQSSLRPSLLRAALVGVVYSVAFGGVWALMSFSSGARSAGPTALWGVTAGVMLLVLLSLGLALMELRLTLSLRREDV